MHVCFIVSVKKCGETTLMPLECSSLSRTAMLSVSGHQPMAVKHFALKRKPKSAALRAEILQKCNNFIFPASVSLIILLYSKRSRQQPQAQCWTHHSSENTQFCKRYE
jgi:hypothetical protein